LLVAGAKIFKEVYPMAGKIFYRERTKAKEGEKKPRFYLVAVAGVDLKFHAKHVRKSELDRIAKELGAELILLERDEEGKYSTEDVEIK
jgi:hypothetical protein